MTDAQIEERLQPFWENGRMFEEPIAFVRSEAGISGRLLYVPAGPVELRDFTGETVFEEGRDFTVDAADRTIRLTENSRIPYFVAEELAGDRGHDDCGTAGKLGNALWCIGPFLYGRQLTASYRFDPAESAADPELPEAGLLPRCVEILRGKGKFRIGFFGDSILEGCDASGRVGRKPHMPPLERLLARASEIRYGVQVETRNDAVGGKNSRWGLETAPEIFADGFVPDLVVVNFGSNDAGIDPAETTENLRGIRRILRERFPETEFLYFSAFHANAEAGFCHGQVRQAELFRELRELHTAYADINTFHRRLLTRKGRFVDLSGNNINHPNDFMIRLYAALALSALR